MLLIFVELALLIRNHSFCL